MSASSTQPINSAAEPRASITMRAVGWLIGLALIAGYAALLLLPIYGDRSNSDFAVTYYPAAQLLQQGGDPFAVFDLYYKQPIVLLMPFIPLTILPLEAARVVWLLIELLLLAGGVVATLRALDFKLTAGRAWLALLVYLSPNIAWGLMIGQSAILIFALQALGMALLRSGRPFLAGLALGAVVLKPHMLAVEIPLLLAAPRRAWAGAVTGVAALLLLPELVGIHLFGSFLNRIALTFSEEKYNKLNPADMFVNLGGGPALLRLVGWVVLAAMALLYLWLLRQIWRARRSEQRWELNPTLQQAMLGAFLFLPYTLAYDIVMVAGSYLWRFKANGYRLDRALTWNLGLLWLLPILTLVLHARGIASTLNPLLIIGLFLLLRQVGKFSPDLGGTEEDHQSIPSAAPAA